MIWQVEGIINKGFKLNLMGGATMFITGFMLGFVMTFIGLTIYSCLVVSSRTSRQEEVYIPVETSTTESTMFNDLQPELMKSHDQFYK